MRTAVAATVMGGWREVEENGAKRINCDRRKWNGLLWNDCYWQAKLANNWTMNTLQELDSSFGLYLHFALYILANYYGLFTIFCSAAFHARMALFRLLSICHYDDLCTGLFSICLYVCVFFFFNFALVSPFNCISVCLFICLSVG